MGNINNVLLITFIALTGMILTVLHTGNALIIAGYTIDMLGIAGVSVFIGVIILYQMTSGGNEMENVTAKKCCLICDHAVIEDIDDMDHLIPCHCRENMKHGGSPCMEQGDVCEHFVLNSLLDPE